MRITCFTSSLFEMAAQCWMWFIWFPAVIHCYNNICEPNKCTATQSSTLGALSADKVIDGDKQQIFKKCSHTAENETGPAWVMVDLGKEYRLKNITIFYRDEKTAGGTWRPYRFRQYDLEISNSSEAKKWTQCYKDNTTFPTVPLSIQNISCEKTARYLRIISNYDAPEDDKLNITGAILEICEIQIYGCLPGHNGQACQPCSKNCRDDSCDRIDGRCIRGCSPGYYGSFCNRTCRKNCENDVCDQTYGNCSCVRGWKPPYCDDCLKGFYGKNCRQSCGHCLDNATCDMVTGACPSGYCEPGWKHTNERRCDKECDDGTFGSYCNNKCSGNCGGGLECNKVDGFCPKGCAKGWINQQCNERCTRGLFGNNCESHCNSNCKDDYCDPSTGKCSEGCKIGFHGEMCNSPCNAKCLNSSCKQENAECNLGCNAGYHGLFCNLDCNSNCRLCDQSSGNCIQCKGGQYGVTCNLNCSAGCKSDECDIKGNCTGGCRDGFYGSQCRETCGRGCLNPCDYRGYCHCLTGWKYTYCKTCESSYFGQNCSERCSNNCLYSECHNETGDCLRCHLKKFGKQCQNTCENCDLRGCNISTGLCINNCKRGFWGRFCNKSCGKCWNTYCDKYTGKCDYPHCQNGYYGEKCDIQCSLQCKNIPCDYNSGDCDRNGCKPGYFGKKCYEECSVNCRESKCNHTNGRCTVGCIADFFGPTCTNPCSGNCFNKSCFQENGTCVEGCKPGFFGDQCKTSCLRRGFCLHDTCYRANGSCNQGCIQGWQDPDCNECSASYYGNACTERCQNCVDGACFRQNGSCINGCIDDCKTDDIINVDNSERQKNSVGTDITIIGAGIGGTVFVLILIVVVVIVLRTRRRTQNGLTQKILYKKNPHDKTEILNGTDLPRVTIRREDETEEPYDENPDEAVYYNDLTTARDIRVSDLSSIIKHKEANENEGFVKEFKTLPYGERFDCETAKLEEHIPKNRFKTTFPYDHSRVILQRNDGFTSDYINANHVSNMEGHSEFIACQGPLAVTLVDHWRMVWQEHIDYIIMLTNLKEGPKVKCHQYWPNDGKRLDADPFVITSMKEKVYACFIERKMVVRKKGVSESRTLVQFHYIQWPDHGTPNPLDLVVFHRQFRHTVPLSQHPILVHCSAGIGRTGTFIALDVLCRYGEKKGKLNVVEYVKAMRKDRMTMIQNADQYAFLYRALYEFFRRKWRLIAKEEFLKLYGDTERPETRKLLTDEFNELTNLRPKYSHDEFKTGKKFAKLNAVKEILPVEKYLVYLTSNIPGREQYYNAVTVSSFSRAEEFISAQFPVPWASVDLIRLLVDQESHFLISLNPLSDDNELKSLVEEEIIKLDSYEITREKQTTFSNAIRKTSLQIKQLKVYSGIHKVHIFECLNWNMKHRIPQEATPLEDLIKQFNLDRKAEKEGHITVISKDGATCCGIFIAVYNAVEQLQQDNLLDIFTIVQQLQCRRPQMISSKEEYEFCIKTMCDFVTFDNIYANT